MSSFKRSQAKYVKQTHKIANWLPMIKLWSPAAR